MDICDCYRDPLLVDLAPSGWIRDKAPVLTPQRYAHLNSRGRWVWWRDYLKVEKHRLATFQWLVKVDLGQRIFGWHELILLKITDLLSPLEDFDVGIRIMKGTRAYYCDIWLIREGYGDATGDGSVSDVFCPNGHVEFVTGRIRMRNFKRNQVWRWISGRHGRP